MQDELQRQTGFVRLKDLGPGAVREKQRPFFVVDHFEVLAFLPIVPDQLRQSATLGHERKSRQHVEAAPADDRVLLDGKVEVADLLAVFVCDFVHPPITDLQWKKVGGHFHALSEKCSGCQKDQQQDGPKEFHRE